MIGFLAGVFVASRLVRRVEHAINPPRSWVAVQMERRVAPYGLEVSNGISLVYTAVMAPVFIVVALLLGAIGLVALGPLGAFAALVVAGSVGHLLALRACEWTVDSSARELLR